VLAWADLARTVATGKNAFERVHGKSIWSWFDAHPHECETFAQAMMGLTISTAPFVADIYPFAEIARVCDVGGGRGTLLSELLVRHRHLHGVLCDAPAVLQSAKSLLERRGVSARTDLVPGNFFEAVPAGAEAYVLKNILHDWDDEASRTILANCRRAMGPGGRVLVVESLVPRNEARGFGPFSDLQMMVACSNGRERSREDFARLFEATDLIPGRVFETPVIAVLEARRA
jgi:hypothetical protein